MDKQATEFATQILDISASGRSGGTGATEHNQVVAWRDGQFECRILPEVCRGNVPQLKSDFTYLYLMEAGPFVKVGMSRKPDNRVRELRTGASHRIELREQFRLPKPGARTKEAACHHLLKPFRSSGEWFKVRLEVAEAVIRHVAYAAPDLSGVQAIIAYELFHGSRNWDERREEQLRLEMAIRSNPTIATSTMIKIFPRIML